MCVWRTWALYGVNRKTGKYVTNPMNARTARNKRCWRKGRNSRIKAVVARQLRQLRYVRCVAYVAYVTVDRNLTWLMMQAATVAEAAYLYIVYLYELCQRSFREVETPRSNLRSNLFLNVGEVVCFSLFFSLCVCVCFVCSWASSLPLKTNNNNNNNKISNLCRQ